MKTMTKTLGLLIISILTINYSFAQWTEDADGIHSTNSSKLVGIGTTTPTAPLDINNNILLGLDYPAYGVRIKANWPGYNGGWSRGFYIANENNTQTYFGLGVTGEATTGVTNMSYAWLGSDYTKPYMSFLRNGNIGIGTNTPVEKLDIQGNIHINAGGDDNHLYWIGHNMTLGTPVEEYAHNTLKLKPGGSTAGILYSGLEMYTANSPTSFDKKVQISTYTNSFFNGGNVGIGTDNPQTKLEVQGIITAGNNASTGGSTILQGSYSSGVLNNLGGVYSSGGTYLSYGLNQNGSSNWLSTTNIPIGRSLAVLDNAFRIYTAPAQTTAIGSALGTQPTEVFTITNSGNTGIGVINPTEKLVVNGNIKAKKLMVTQNSWADYVFDKDYKLMNLNDLSTYIQQYKHLPEVPSTKDIQTNGVDVGNNQTLLLKKIEELTLYIIEQHKEIETLKKEIKKRN